MSINCAPTLDDLLADPMVQAVMSADHVDAASLRRDMNRTAARIARPLDLAGARVRFAHLPARTALPRAPGKAGGEQRFCC